MREKWFSVLERAGKNYRVRRVGSLNNLFVLENPTKLARCPMASFNVRLVSDRGSRRRLKDKRAGYRL